MSTQFFSSTGSHGYTSLWNKYRPAILQQMVAADEDPQVYKFFKHEFKALNPKEKSYSFTLEAYQGKALNDIRKFPIAKDLLEVLVYSPKASELMENNRYEFILDKQFVLHIKKLDPIVEEEEIEEEEVASEEVDKGKSK